MAFGSILVANRGEIALRVIKTAKGLGLRTVAVYTDADAKAGHVKAADDAVNIGVGPVGDSYLSVEKILTVAKQTGAEAIHPGYGFLSENHEFAHTVIDAGLTFIGPEPGAIQTMGNKAESKRLMIEAGVPCVPGYQGTDQSDDVLMAEASCIGYPLIIKAVAGGGGRGMRLVFDETEDLQNIIAQARSEALNAFGNSELIIEKAIISPRHVEVQLFADTHGNVVHLGERDCSVQRRHQKIVEEAPCPVMTPKLRQAMGEAAVDAAKAVNYRGAGTVEFLLDASGEFYFIEMNTRLQVEHPVTELITGLDLVELQITVAQGDPLPFSQEDVVLSGHAMEVRLYAEDPANGYLPTTGTVNLWREAVGKGIRVDGGISQGQEVSSFYDPMLAKIIAYGPTRDVARRRLISAVEKTVLLGTRTNTTFLANLLAKEGFEKGEATTAFLDEAYPDGYSEEDVTAEEFALVSSLFFERQKASALTKAGFVADDQMHWTSAPLTPASLKIIVNDSTVECLIMAVRGGWCVAVMDQHLIVDVLEISDSSVKAKVGDRTLEATYVLEGDSLQLASRARRLFFKRLRAGAQEEGGASSGLVKAPMPGLVIETLVKVGDTVSAGARLATLEAMKMQHQILAEVDGKIEAVKVSEGDQIIDGQIMIEIAPNEYLVA